MSTVLHLNEKNYVPVSTLVTSVPYSRDHITRLAREQKINSVLIGRQWYVEPSSLQSYIESMELEQAIRQRHLSITRKQERMLQDQLAAATASLTVVPAKLARTKVATWWSATVVVCGIGVGMLLSAADLFPSRLPLPTIPSTQFAAAVVSDLPVRTTLPSEFNPNVTPVVFTPTTEFDVLPTNGVGVLLVPGVAPTAADLMAITDLFSDPVVVRRNEAGVRVVAAVDASGEAAPGGIPFITVPLTHVGE